MANSDDYLATSECVRNIEILCSASRLQLASIVFTSKNGNVSCKSPSPLLHSCSHGLVLSFSSRERAD